MLGKGEWREAEADLGSAISTADRDTRMDPALLKSLLADYAHAAPQRIIMGGRLAPSKRVPPP